MDFLEKLRRQIHGYLFVIITIQTIVVIGAVAIILPLHILSPIELLVALGIAGIIGAIPLSKVASEYTTQPLTTLWQAIQHVSPHGEQQPAPNLNKLKVGKELVSTLVNHIYQLASVVDNVNKTSGSGTSDLHANFLATALPIPLIVLNKDDQIIYLNEAACKYIRREAQEVNGQNVYTVLDMSFASDHTLDSWLKDAKERTVTADSSWERVRIGLPGQGDSLQFDLAAHYNQDNPLGYETLLVLFDHTAIYSQDDQAMSFVALSVHELRTPLTLLRGYIEVFDEELGPNLTPELKSFMKKMDASAQQLAAFVDNILNVAKIEDNQLTLQLREETWQTVVEMVVRDMSLRAAVRGVSLKCAVSPDLPTVGVDRYSIYEVLANLLDNAIKYCGNNKEISVTAELNKDGLIETSVIDKGVGIDASILPHIFDKFYRNHRNRAQIGGTGLGLYLAKAIVDAHGGQIWVRSKPGEGSTFSFTLQSFTQVAKTQQTGESAGITRNAHGWIKNHSLYRD